MHRSSFALADGTAEEREQAEEGVRLPVRSGLRDGHADGCRTRLAGIYGLAAHRRDRGENNDRSDRTNRGPANHFDPSRVG